MTAQELYTRISRGDQFLVLDVRTADARSMQPYQIPGALWVPLAAVVEQTASLPREHTIVIY